MTCAELLAKLRKALSVDAVDYGDIEAIGNAKGAYVLLIGLAEPLAFQRKAIGGAELDGWLVYIGSARGGGGIRARLDRHMRRGKAVRWHVDELTNAASQLAALAVPDGEECAIVDLLRQSGFATAMRGFGSSDCRHCEAHLLRPE